MNDFRQGDIIKIGGFGKRSFVIVSRNAFINATGVFHVCPMTQQIPAGPVHIPVVGHCGESGTVICEQIKAIDPKARECKKTDWLAYADIMNVSDAVQGILEYD